MMSFRPRTEASLTALEMSSGIHGTLLGVNREARRIAASTLRAYSQWRFNGDYKWS
jgi:hypothetical protein